MSADIGVKLHPQNRDLESWSFDSMIDDVSSSYYHSMEGSSSRTTSCQFNEEVEYPNCKAECFLTPISSSPALIESWKRSHDHSSRSDKLRVESLSKKNKTILKDEVRNDELGNFGASIIACSPDSTNIHLSSFLYSSPSDNSDLISPPCIRRGSDTHIHPDTQAGDSPEFAQSLPKRRISDWYQSSVARSYSAKVYNFQRAFKNTPVDTSRLLVDYSCAFSKGSNGLLHQGRMYITEKWICFYSKIIHEQKIHLSVKDIISVSKAKTARLIPNAIILKYAPNGESYFFTSFAARERTLAILKKVCENSKVGLHILPSESQVTNMQDLLCQVQNVYGDDGTALLDFDEHDDPIIYSDMPFDFDSSSSECVRENDSIQPYHTAGIELDLTNQIKTKLESNPHKNSHKTSYDYGPLKSEMLSMSDGNNFSSPIVSEKINSIDEFSPSHFGHASLTNNDSPPCGESFDNESDTSEKSNSKRCLEDQIEDGGIILNFPPTMPKLSSENTADQRKNRIRRKKTQWLRANTAVGYVPSEDDLKASETLKDFGPVYCGSGHQHSGRIYADATISLSVDALFACLFTDSPFFSNFCKSRGTFDIIQDNWPNKPWRSPSDYCSSDQCVQRTISYTLSLKQLFGPRFCTVEEQQSILLKDTTPGIRYVVDAKVTNQALPLCNSFHVVSRYCLLRRSPTASQLMVSSEVFYDKPVFFGAKTIIESTCKSNLTDSFTDMVNQLRVATSNLSHECRISGGHLVKSQCVISKETTVQNIEKSSSVTAAGAAIVARKEVDYPHGQCQQYVMTDWSRFSFKKSANQPELQSVNPDSHSPFVTAYPKSDRNWLLLIALSLFLCICLSYVYNRHLQLQQLVHEMDFSQNNEKEKRLRRLLDSFLNIDDDLHAKLNIPSSHSCSQEVESIKSAIQSISGVMDRMMNILTILEERLGKLSQVSGTT